MITIQLNGKPYVMAPTITLHDLLLMTHYVESFMAIAINGRCVPREAYQTTALQHDDVVDVIVPMQGG